jgi:tetratricopeptide (TPR) repeat protein
MAFRYGYSTFYNPFWVAPATQPAIYLNYSQPLQIVQPPPISYDESAPPPQAPPAPDEQAMQLFDSARGAFLKGDYAAARRDVEAAIQRMPKDAVLHEFRALVLFAQGDFKESASAIYSLLAVQPGWDWTTMMTLYGDNASAYEKHLRALEQARDADPQAPYLHFLLAYHYLVAGHTEAAQRALEAVVKILPKDQLSAQLLTALTGEAPKGGETPPKPDPEAPKVEMDIKGTWKAERPDGGSIGLALKEDGKFQWSITDMGKADSFDGAFTLDGEMLMLERSAGGVLLARVAPLTKDSFSFRLIGAPANDPGLTFRRG